MIASLAALALANAPLTPSPRVTASTSSTLMLALSAAHAQAFALLALPRQNKHITKRNGRESRPFLFYSCNYAKNLVK
jgi:hypothetical protein